MENCANCGDHAGFIIDVWSGCTFIQIPTCDREACNAHIDKWVKRDQDRMKSLMYSDDQD